MPDVPLMTLLNPPHGTITSYATCLVFVSPRFRRSRLAHKDAPHYLATLPFWCWLGSLRGRWCYSRDCNWKGHPDRLGRS